MKPPAWLWAVPALAAPALAMALSVAKVEPVTVTDAWVRATVPQQKATGLFMQLSATQDLRLVGASSPVAGVVEIHEMRMEGDVMKMRPVPGGLALAKGQSLSLKPGGYHVMLMDLKEPLTEGRQVRVNLLFETAPGQPPLSQDITAVVKALGAGTPSHDHSHDHGHTAPPSPPTHRH